MKVEIEDLQVVGKSIFYTTDNGLVFQWDSFSEEITKDEMQQFALILSIGNQAKTIKEDIDKHMHINGYDGYVDIYLEDEEH